MKCAFVGLGVMGYPMAGYLLKAGHEVTVYNRTSGKVDAWCSEYGGAAAPTPAKAAAGADIVMLDNFAIEDLHVAVEINGGRATLEASGNVDDSKLRAIADTGASSVRVAHTAGSSTSAVIAGDSTAASGAFSGLLQAVAAKSRVSPSPALTTGDVALKRQRLNSIP